MPEISLSEWQAFEALFLRSGFSRDDCTRLAPLRLELSRFLHELLLANETTNVTAITDFSSAVWKHLYDSLILAGHLPRGSFLDLGTGGGLPGIPLALFRRALGIVDPVCLLDSVKKKAALVDGFCKSLSLANCVVSSERGELLLQKQSFTSVVMRAVAPPERALPWVSRTTKNYFFMTGPTQIELWKASEAKMLKRGFHLQDIIAHELPNGLGDRFIAHFQLK
jgi:16S rRNA (guanine527-N7)-methyltransferase